MSRHPTVTAGKRLGRYLIKRELGRGGMGVVYVAEDSNTGRQVALKTTMVAGLGGGEASRNQRRQRFVREIKALTQLNHDNVVHVLDAGEADDPDLGWLLFYAMEHVEGETLAQLVQRTGALEAGVAAAVCMQVAAGLGAAHRAGIVHRDVKPANIFISLSSRALIGDFGICKMEGQTQITRRDQLVGTPNYLAPEQILGEHVGPAADVFAIGALFYVVTMNRPLRPHVDAAALLQSAQGNEPKERVLAERAIPAELRLVIARCLERDPKLRWRDGQQLADGLAAFATRIPSLSIGTANEPLLDTAVTSDRSSPFMSLPSVPSDEFDVLVSAEMPAERIDVETAARTLLGEVDKREIAAAQRRSNRSDKSPRSATAVVPLPVAKTESTMMFNLRALEDESNKLPVAHTEPTGAVMMKAPLSPPAPVFSLPAQTLVGPVEETTLAGEEPPPANIVTEARAQGEAAPASRVAGASPIAQQARTRSWKLRAPRLSRPSLIGVSAACGALLGVGLVLGFAKPSISLERAQVVGSVVSRSVVPRSVVPRSVVPRSVVSRNVVPRQRPLICPESNDAVAVDAAVGGRKAHALVDQALKGESEGAEAPKRRALLQAAIQEDPHNAQAFFELGRVLIASDASGGRAAFACVCIVSPVSPQCQRVKDQRLDE